MGERFMKSWGLGPRRRQSSLSSTSSSANDNRLLLRHACLCCLSGSVTGMSSGDGGEHGEGEGEGEVSSSGHATGSSSASASASSSSRQAESEWGKRARPQQAHGEEEEEEHPVYRGVRRRSWGKWVSEIREPKKKSRIWLGSFSSPQMAARAYDVAAFSLKGPDAQLNFPEARASLPRPASLSAKSIQAAASEYAVQMNASNNSGSSANTSADADAEAEPCYMDEDMIFNMHGVLSGMAEAMLLDVRRPSQDSDPDEGDDDEGPGLWD